MSKRKKKQKFSNLHNQKTSRQSLILNAYDIPTIFEDSYEHKVYFELVNSINILELCPSEIEVEFSMKSKQLRLSFPNNKPDLVKVIVPITKTQNNRKKRLELRDCHLKQYGELVPKMRLSIKNQLAAMRKTLVNPEEAALIEKKVKKLRRAGLQKTKLSLKGIK